MGTTDISGVVLGAQQRLGLDKSSTTQQTLGAMGLSFGSAEAQNALTSGGLEGYERFYNDQNWSLQQQSKNLQWSQLSSNESNMYATWDIQDRTTSQQYGSQMDQFSYSLNRMDLQQQFQRENWASQDTRRQTGVEQNRWQTSFNHETSLMQRDFSRENTNFQTQMQNMSYSWSMEDYDEAIRRSSGYERAQLVKRRDRETTTYSLNSQNNDRAHGNQEELWAREDERYKKSLAYTEQINQLNEEDFTRQRSQQEELFKMERDNTVRRQDDAVSLHELQMELQKEQRKHQEEQLAFSKKSLEIQTEMARNQHEYSTNVREFTQSREKDEAAMRKLIGYAPAFARMAEDWIKMIDRLDRSSLATTTYSPYNGVR